MQAAMQSSGLKPALKRKRRAKAEPRRKRARSETSDSASDGSRSGSENDGDQAKVLLLESEILDSKKHYNNIVRLLEIAKTQKDEDVELALVAAVSLCRVFVRLLAAGRLAKTKGLPEKEALVVIWLREKQAEYKEHVLLPALRREEAAGTVLTLAMRVLKAEGQSLGEPQDYSFPRGFLQDVVWALVQPNVNEWVRGEFVEKFVEGYDDVRFYTFQAIRELLTRLKGSDDNVVVDNLLDLLLAIETVPDSADELEDFYVEPPKNRKHALFSLLQHKKQAEQAWLAILALGLRKFQKKKVLGSMTASIAPWFTRPELLMDFLTDCYDAGGSTSLLALSGVFHLIQERNLDYPAFYRKLYSLITPETLHSKHRSRFLRLLETFLASSHLPAALVASFIKRLARLALNAPPAAVVAIVPWFYNLFKKHPLTTFMMHRVRGAEGQDDPFLADEEDPMETRAIDSCVWEVVQLQSHYHPNVATVAKIVSEQFTKQFYVLEDFLDHSYASLLEAELKKEVKKSPVVEFKIPKRIFTRAEAGEQEQEENLLAKMWGFHETDGQLCGTLG